MGWTRSQSDCCRTETHNYPRNVVVEVKLLVLPPRCTPITLLKMVAEGFCDPIAAQNGSPALSAVPGLPPAPAHDYSPSQVVDWLWFRLQDSENLRRSGRSA
ncbi:protein of unknown function [Rhodococcus sp. RD6.2]|nr:protein of unknown function [Rhodococcus sp. RD6.2]